MPLSPHHLPIDPHLLNAEESLFRFSAVRILTEKLVKPLSAEDMVVQSMEEASPTKWHLAHTTWFHETFILKVFDPDYKIFDPDYHFLFNSYYEAEGPRHPRPHRGLLSRPPLSEIMAYRGHVTAAVQELVGKVAGGKHWRTIAGLIELGCHHEEQHQELLLTDIKHVLSCNPLKPAYKSPYPKEVRKAPDMEWVAFAEGLYEIGHAGDGFAFDCEGPRHKTYLNAFSLASRPVTNGDYLAFMVDGGYKNPALWLSDAWAQIQAEERHAPLYWREKDGGWQVFTLFGEQPVNFDEPASHLSYYEADAFATWAGARLPREAELELALAAAGTTGAVNDLGNGRYHPAVAGKATAGNRLQQLFGDVWEWTATAFAPYPRFKPAPGAIGEYNGKFMCNQFVLRGGSCVTPAGHVRPTYRNFFFPHSQWQFTGIRLAKDL